jgi:hypothetical protein
MKALQVLLFASVVVGVVGVRSAVASPTMIRLGCAGCASCDLSSQGGDLLTTLAEGHASIREERRASLTAGARLSTCFPPLRVFRCKANGVATLFSVRCPQMQRARRAVC